jgi:hypothetical protein
MTPVGGEAMTSPLIQQHQSLSSPPQRLVRKAMPIAQRAKVRHKARLIWMNCGVISTGN